MSCPKGYALLFVNSKSNLSHCHQRLSLVELLKSQTILFLFFGFFCCCFSWKNGLRICFAEEWLKQTHTILSSSWGETLTMMHDLTVSSSLKSIVLNRLRLHTIQLYSRYCLAGFPLQNIWRYENLVWPIYFDLGEQLYLIANVCRVRHPYITLPGKYKRLIGVVLSAAPKEGN